MFMRSFLNLHFENKTFEQIITNFIQQDDLNIEKENIEPTLIAIESIASNEYANDYIGLIKVIRTNFPHINKIHKQIYQDFVYDILRNDTIIR
jgi:aryl-phospho-beta-D-glucosidase BglC (GH1 family)